MKGAAIILPTPKKAQGKLMRRICCPDCGGRLRKVAEGTFKCEGECGDTLQQIKLWEGNENDKK